VFFPFILTDGQEIWAILLIILVGSVPGTVLLIAFNALFADLIPLRERGRVVGRRNALLAISLTLSTLVCGFILDKVAFPYNYQLVFALGGVTALMSSFSLTRLRRPGVLPARQNRPILDFARVGALMHAPSAAVATGFRFLTRGGGKPLLRLDLLRTPFGPFMLSYLVFYACQYVGIPLYPVFMVRDLALTDSQISIGFVFFYMTMFLGSLQINWMSKRWGYKRILVTGALLFGFYPLLMALSQGPTLYWVTSLIGGLIWALISAGLTSRLMERVPEAERPAGMALHNLVMNTGTLTGSLTGPLVADSIGMQPALFFSALVRFVAGFVLLRWG